MSNKLMWSERRFPNSALFSLFTLRSLMRGSFLSHTESHPEQT